MVTYDAVREEHMQTHTYKAVDGLDIRAEVHRPDDDRPRPVIVSIHGGALIMGHRESMDDRLTKPLLGRGYVIVSIDYRLAPETQLPALIEDIEDAWTWVHEEGPRLFGADVSRVGVTGNSAGGYLTLVCGHRCTPRPAALVSVYGYGDLVGDWYSQPSPHERHHGTKATDEEALAQVSGPPISDSRDRDGDGGLFYNHCRQKGTWPRSVSGWDPVTEADRFVPYMPVNNVTADYPPTVLIHGTTDTDVPYEQSALMADALAREGVEHELCTVDGGEHGLGGGNPQQIRAGYDAALRLFDKHVGGGVT